MYLIYSMLSGIPLTLETVIAILVISAAVLTYAKHPLQQQQQTGKQQLSEKVWFQPIYV